MQGGGGGLSAQSGPAACSYFKEKQSWKPKAQLPRPGPSTAKGTHAAMKRCTVFIEAFSRFFFKHKQKGNHSTDWLRPQHTGYITPRDRLEAALSPPGARMLRWAEAQWPRSRRDSRGPRELHRRMREWRGQGWLIEKGTTFQTPLHVT